MQKKQIFQGLVGLSRRHILSPLRRKTITLLTTLQSLKTRTNKTLSKLSSSSFLTTVKGKSVRSRSPITCRLRTSNLLSKTSWINEKVQTHPLVIIHLLNSSPFLWKALMVLRGLDPSDGRRVKSGWAPLIFPPARRENFSAAWAADPN